MTGFDENKMNGLLQEAFGLQSFRRGQREIISAVLNGHDTMAVMPTGGGKSLCYQLPALFRPGVTLVISPLIALMRDQVRALTQKGIAAGALHSDQTLEEKKEVFANLTRHKSYLLYLSPERVQKEGFSSWYKTAQVSLVAIDEAHCISQWGHDFREEYNRLNLLRTLRPEIPILILTATATPRVLSDVSERLGLQKPKRHVYGFYRPNLYYQVETCSDDDEKMRFLRQALKATPSGRVIIYAGTRKKCEELTQSLSRSFSQVGFYHAGLESDERTLVQKQFDEGELRILVATIAFGMGVDVPDVRLIVHYQMPASIESYYQEIGRAGRDNLDSTCILLYSRQDKGLHSYFIRESKAPKEVIIQRWYALKTIVQFAEGGECRHAGILTYFRDQERIQACGHCDICLPDSARKIQPEAPSSYLEPKKVLRLAKERKKKSRSASDRPLSHEEELRLRVVKDWRYQYAKDRDIPAFLIFSNKTLEDLARKKPRTLEDLAHVYGIGPQKIETFGKELLQQIADL